MGQLLSNIASVTVTVSPVATTTTKTYASTGAPGSIPMQGTILATLAVTDSFTLSDLNVKVNIQE